MDWRKPLKLLSEVEEMIEIVKEILMVVGSATVALVVACFLTVLKEKIKSWRKNGCKIKCLCKHKYDF